MYSQITSNNLTLLRFGASIEVCQSKRITVLHFEIKIKSFVIFVVGLPYFAEACNEFAGPISASSRPSNTASFQEMPQRWRAVGNTMSNLTGPSFELQTYRSRSKKSDLPIRRSNTVPLDQLADFTHFRAKLLK